MHQPLHNACAARRHTARPLPAIDPEAVLKIAQIAIRLPVIAQGRAARGDRIGQNLPDQRHQTGGLGPAQAAGAASGVDTGAEQHLADIDIAQPRHQMLIEQRGLDRRVAPGKPRHQIGFVKFIAQRLWPQHRQQRMRLRRGRRHQIHRAKAAGVIEGHARAALQIKHHMVMFRRCRMGVMERTQNRAGNQHPPRHAQMDQQAFPAGQIGQNVFRPAAQRLDPCAGQALGHAGWKGPAQIGAVDLRLKNKAARHHRLQPATDGFNLGQFGHSVPLDSWAHCSARIAPYKVWQKQWRQVQMTDDEQKTHFGFQTVNEAEKAGMVHGVFTRVASKYDIMNDVMSMGIHRIWKDAMMDWLAPRPGQRLLDVAGGTGDVSFRFLNRAPGAHATVLDMTESMLVEGRQRAEASDMADRLDWVVGDAMALPFKANTFDVYTISFGIRNVTRVQDALNEAYRVLRPGGRLMVLEFSQLPNATMQKAYDLYSFNVIPVMGQIIANDRDSYQYLVESIRKFPDQDTFAAMIRRAGFGQVSYRNLSLGIAALHSGWKL